MNRDAGAALINSLQWRQFLDSAAAALQLNLIFKVSEKEYYESVCEDCHVCQSNLGSERVTEEDLTDGLRIAPADYGKSSAENCDNSNWEYQTTFRLSDEAVISARRCKQCEAEITMPFHDTSEIAEKLLVSYFDIASERLSSAEYSRQLSALRAASHFILSTLWKKKDALKSALSIILSASVILFSASGSWFEYSDGNISAMLTKGYCKAQSDLWSRNDRDFIRAAVKYSNIQGQICVQSPADIKKSGSLIEQFVKELELAFEIDNLIKLMESRCDLILSAIGNPVMLISRAMIIFYANEAAADMLNASVIELHGCRLTDIAAPWNECILNKTYKPVKGIKDKLFEKYINWSVFPVIEEGGASGWIITAEDCTDYYRMQDIGQKAEIMVSSSLMLRSLAHEIRNPLATLRGILQLIMQNEESEESMNYLERGIKEVDRVTKLMNDFIQMREPPFYTGELLDLKSFLDDLRPLYNSLLTGKSIKIIINSNEPAAISIDPEQLTQVLINIIKNAVEVLKDSGYISISTRLINREWVEIQVKDTGTGISKDSQGKLFEPFYSTKEGGTGLGLSICKAIIHNNGGEISARNQPEGGAIFSIILPTSAYNKNQIPELDVLLVTSDEMLRISLEQIMTSEGFKTISVNSFENAMFIIKRCRLYLVVFDDEEIDFIKYHSFQKAYSMVKAIIIGSEASMKEYKDTFYISKPVNYQKLVNSIKALIDNNINYPDR